MSDVQTLVYLAEDRPVLLRLHVLIDGKPYPAAWDAWMKKLFDYLDVNGDGSLSRAEAARVPSVQVLRNHYRGVIVFFRGGSNPVPFAELDADKDGKVTPAELQAYFRKSGLGSFQIRSASGQGRSGVMTEALFKQLDRNGDGKLSRAELAVADEVLHRLDIDEDEMISEDELVPPANPFLRFAYLDDGSGQPAPPTFQMLTPGEAGTRIVKAIMDRYDKDRNGKLSKTEVAFDEATFARIDTNKDGQIDAAELEKWLAGPSDLELTVRLGQLPPKRRPGGFLKAIADASRGPGSDASVELTPGKAWSVAGATRTEGDGIVLTHGIAQIDVRGDNQNRFFGQNNGVRGFYLQQFKQALKDNKDFVEKKDVDNNGQFPIALFQYADRNGDGKLTEKELNAFLDAIDDGANASATLAVADHGAGLFELLDANRDHRLSIRELRTGWERVAPWDKAKVGAITREQIPRQYTLTVRQGPPDNARFRQITRMGVPMQAGSSRGPLWFRKMDRNGDGDVSPREWLGSLEDFQKIDTDHDGLISAEEAEKADAWFRAHGNERK